MQSGISASQELQDAFQSLVSSPDQRGLLAGIKNEQLVLLETIPCTTSGSSDFSSDLSQLAGLLKDNEPAYVILRRYPDASDAFVAATYVPDTAQVRQKMLFASTRLTLVRELGAERFRETIFVTSKDELTAEGFRKLDRHAELKAPLTEEEQTLQEVRKAEAEAGRGTSGRSSHVSSGVSFPTTDDSLQALRGLTDGPSTLVQLRINVSKETIELDGTSETAADELSQAISDTEPRFSFFRYVHEFEGQRQEPIAFIYTCPSGSKIKERMVYASSRAGVLASARNDAGLAIAETLEVSNPSEITEASLQREFHPVQEQKARFSKPKRPGR